MESQSAVVVVAEIPVQYNCTEARPIDNDYGSAVMSRIKNVKTVIGSWKSDKSILYCWWIYCNQLVSASSEVHPFFRAHLDVLITTSNFSHILKLLGLLINSISEKVWKFNLLIWSSKFFWIFIDLIQKHSNNCRNTDRIPVKNKQTNDHKHKMRVKRIRVHSVKMIAFRTRPWSANVIHASFSEL